MSATERRLRLLTVLCFRRHDTCENLAREFDVTIRTIYSDIEVLMCSYPIETVRGRYGGVKVADGFYLGNHALSPRQFELLDRLLFIVSMQAIVSCISHSAPGLPAARESERG